MRLLLAITAAKIVLAASCGGTVDIVSMGISAEAFLSGRDIYDPNFTEGNPGLFPIGHHLIIGGAMLLSRAGGLPFAFLIKLPAILSDLMVALLLRSMARGGDRVALLYLLNPLTLLLSVYHGQLHSVATAGAAFALWLVEKGGVGAGAAALGLAASVRQHFSLLAAPLLIWLKTAGDRGRFAVCLGLTAFVVNAWIFSYGGPGRLFAPTITYGSWGYTMLLLQGPRVLELFGLDGAASAMAGVNEIVRFLGTRINLAWALAYLAWVLARPRDRELDLWRAGLLYCAGMYAFAPGIGVQWLVWAVPFWLVADRREAVVYTTLAGAYTAGAYWQWTLNSKYALRSLTANLPLIERGELAGVLLVGTIGLLTWLFVARAAWRLALGGAPAKASSTEGGKTAA